MVSNASASILKQKKAAIIIGSFILAYYAVIPTLNLMIARIMLTEDGMMNQLYLIGILLLLIYLLRFNCHFYRYSVYFIITFLSITIAYFLTLSLNCPTTLEPKFFIIMTVLPLCLPQLVFVDAAMVIRLMMALPAFGILFISKIFNIADTLKLAMDFSYSLVPPIVASIVYIFTIYANEKPKNRIIMTCFIVVNFIYFIFLFLFGSRGPSLCALSAIIFMLCIKINQNQRGIYAKWKMLIPMVICVLGIVVFFEDILYMVQNFLHNIGVESGMIDIMIKYYEMGDLSDGRGDIQERAIRAISASPIYGYGLSSSEKYTHDAYPHNFILQLLLDGGIILLILVTLPMIFMLVKYFKNGTYLGLTLVIVLFFSSVPGALFSLDLWTNARFWVFMGVLMSSRYMYSCRKINDFSNNIYSCS